MGHWLSARLRRAGFEVVARDRELDVTRPEELRDGLARVRPDAVIHLAALSSVVDSHAHARQVYTVNYLGSRALLTAVAEQAPKARILLVGSGQIYGAGPPGTPPRDERAPLRPDSPYARSKAAADLLGARWAARGLDVVRARSFNHTGPGQTDAFVASSFARQIAEIEVGARPARLQVGCLDAVRDFLDVADVVEAYVRLLDGAAPAGAYNVARGAGVTIREILEGLLRHSTTRPEIQLDPARVRPADVLVGSAERIERATGWRPAIPLSDTLARLLDHWRGVIGARS